MNKFARLKRNLNPMPPFVKEALESNNLVSDFENRPAYQQNDYLGWISRAKREATRQRRLAQMLDELEKGGVYMKMSHPASSKKPLKSQ